MKKYLIVGIASFILLTVFFSGCSSFNSMVTSEEVAESSWADVETQYQRRLDLIPNLVSAVQGYANFEKSTFVEVTEARASATQIKLDPSNMDSLSLAKFEAAQQKVSSTLARLMVVVEKYPDLKASEQFISLQSELSGTENRIAVARKDFNGNVKDYNTYIKKFPKNIWSKMFSFKKKAYFQADYNAKNAPTVKFN